MLWYPLNLTSTCPTSNNLTACSSFAHVYLNLLFQMFGNSIDDDKYEKEIKVDLKERYDFIVVGAGSSGCVVANRLSEIPDWNVLLLEAGPEQPDITLVPSLHKALRHSNVDWGFSSLRDNKTCLAWPNQVCKWTSGKMMGGSSSTDSLLYLRGDMNDYDGWAALGNTGWSYKEVLPYFKKSECNLDLKYKHLYPRDVAKPFIDILHSKYHNVVGNQPVSFSSNTDALLTKAFKEKGLPYTDFNKHTSFGSGQAQSTIENGIRMSTNYAFIKNIRNKRKNLTIKTNSEVIQILIDDNTYAAYGVKYKTKEIVNTVLAAKEIVLTAGAVNSAKLLLYSGVGPKKDLQSLNITVMKNLKVGSNMQQHIGFEGLITYLPKKYSRKISKGHLLKEIYECSEKKIMKGDLSQNGPVTSTSFAKSSDKVRIPDIQYTIGSLYEWREYQENPVGYRAIDIFPTVYYNGFQPRIKLLTPKSRGKIKLNPQNPDGPPLIFGNYFERKSDLETVINATELLYELENTGALLTTGVKFVKKPVPYCENFKWGTKEYTKCLALYYTSIEDNPVGTCKMGPETDPSAVVNPRLSVYGIEGLRVVDASIMPVITKGSITTASMMIGEKGSDMIKEDWWGALPQPY